MHEVRARLAELRQVGEHRERFDLDEVAISSAGTAQPEATAAEALILLLLRLQRDG